MTNADGYTQKIVFLKQECALARLALQKLCDQHGLNFDELLADVDDNELVQEMQRLQNQAEEYAKETLGT